MRRIWLARHGNRQDFVDETWAQSAEKPHDPDLSPDGIVQARELSRRLRGEKLHHVLVSPFLRTLRTAHLCAEPHGLPLRIEYGLCEWLNPAWYPGFPDLHQLEKNRERFPNIDPLYRSVLQPLYPETPEKVQERCAKAIRLILARTEGNLLLVGHGASCTSMVRALAHRTGPLPAALCALFLLEGEGESWELLLNGDTCHLSSGSGSGTRWN